MSDKKSYDQVFRSAYVTGGSNGVQYLAGFIQIKVIAILLGPSGIGLISLYRSIFTIIATIAAFGINRSSVREIAKASAIDDKQGISKINLTLKRLCWVTGVFGWIGTMLLSGLISEWVFQSPDYSKIITLLGVIALITIIRNGHFSLLQGMRRINDLARINIGSALINMVVSVFLYLWLGEQGIVPVLISTAIITLLISWWFTRQIELPVIKLTTKEMFSNSKILLRLGFAFLISSLIMTSSDVVIKSMIIREFGLDEVGYYQAAWSISGLFAGFILGSMGMDYYPRLTGVIDNRFSAIKCVNEQTEIGILMAVPILVSTIVFSSSILQLLYSSEFTRSDELLVYFAIGVFGRIVGWPMGFIMLATSSSKLYMFTEVLFGIINISLVFWMLPKLGVISIAYAMMINYALYILFMLRVGRRLIGFSWSKGVNALVLRSVIIIFISYGIFSLLNGWIYIVSSISFVIFVTTLSIKGLLIRFGSDHKLYKIFTKSPLMEKILNLKKI
jgi:enterobacterial common antigen flippase